MKSILNNRIYLPKHFPLDPVVESIPFNGTTIRIVRAAGKAASLSCMPALLVSTAIGASICIGQAVATKRKNHH